MGQGELNKWLKGRGWVNTNDMVKYMNTTKSSLNSMLRSMVYYKEIERKKDKTKKNGYLYRLR